MIELATQLFAGPALKLAAYGAFFLALIGIYLAWRSSVKYNAVAKYNQRQLEQSIKDMQEAQTMVRDLAKLAEQAALELEKARDEWAGKRRELEKFLSSPEAVKGNRDSSWLLKEIVRRMGK